MTDLTTTDPDKDEEELAQHLLEETMNPLLIQLESIGATGVIDLDDKITISAVMKAAHTSLEIITRVCREAGMPDEVVSLARVTARQTAAQYMDRLHKEAAAWAKAHGN